MSHRLRAAVLSLLTVLALGACGTLPRDTAPIRLADTALSRGVDPRLNLEDAAAREALGAAMDRAVRAHGQAPTILAISGGGADGAYGAGVLTGWSERGDRPAFDLVTGVSTGALTAPFAFLGSDWDDELRAAYTGGQTEGLVSWRSLSTLTAPSLLSPRILSGLVNTHVTPELLRRVAEEHARGRRLLVVTTNLDAEAAVVWDMGQIATQGDANALALFREVLLASASIPGVFPPVLIATVQRDGTIVREMHVDGGVTVPFLASPGGPVTAALERSGRGNGVAGRVFIIINGQAGRQYAVTSGRISAILGRAYITSSKAATARELAAAVTFAGANHLDLFITDIPTEAESSSLDFDQAAMTSLFELGHLRGLEGDAWRAPDGGRPAGDDVRAEQLPGLPDAAP